MTAKKLQRWQKLLTLLLHNPPPPPFNPTSESLPEPSSTYASSRHSEDLTHVLCKGLLKLQRVKYDLDIGLTSVTLILFPSWQEGPGALCREKHQGRMDRAEIQQTISHFLCGRTPLSLSSPFCHELIPTVLCLTAPTRPSPSPIYCYLYL